MHTDTTHRIFVYGILMREAREAATLPGYRLAFDCFATIVPAEGERVQGGIIETDDLGLRRYDSIEGVDHERPEDGYYRRDRVTLADGSEAWAYRMNQVRERIGPDPGLVRDMQRQYERLGHVAA
jgi:gamma-glutamylcyclotransferase (GGCT)/AIG2-like uncharacterized protein YtfP